ncbi:IncI2 plasmid replication initiation leader protein RepR [Escherichia coli]|uniref:Replication initiation leader protein n=3 Tax=Enterobacteriaceae TaxID=543 RepID=A0A1W6F5S1_SHISO|nr:putative regulatory reading frame [Escherichia coli]AGW44917.1 RepR [Klebsiella pneumoniae]AHG18138.1 replication initiation leader sequence [Escherichia coli O145:H28 str. RM13516]AHY68345.1 replication initiation leader sequence [Escherichia coli O145:H28 str. RM12761]ARK35901.1 Replication initiation leader protein [Shigella sonnei]CEG62629.2 RepR [Salmonella enterica]
MRRKYQLLQCKLSAACCD